MCKYLGKLSSDNTNNSDEKHPNVQQHKKCFAHVSQVINTTLPKTTIPSDSTYNQCGYLHQHQQYKSEMFARNVKYTIKCDNNPPGTILTYKQGQYEHKFENFDFSANNMNLDGLNYVEIEQNKFGGKHQKHQGDENFDSFMETDDENNPIRMS